MADLVENRRVADNSGNKKASGLDLGEDVLELKVLMNPLILDAIFGKLSVYDLTVIRQVCKLWGDAGGKALGNKTVLPLKHIWPICVPKLEPLTFNEKLAKHLSVRIGGQECICDCDPRVTSSWSPRTADNKISNFFSLPPGINEITQNLELITDQAYFHSVMDLINTVPFSNLDSFSISITHLQILDVFESNCSACPERQSLKNVELKCTKWDNENCWSRTYSAFQRLLNSAPNLEHLLINGNFFPNLFNCTRLKVLHYTGLESEGLNINAMLRMLESVRRSIVEFTLDCATSYHWRGLRRNIMEPQHTLCRLPKMPNLVCLNIHEVGVYRLENSLDNDTLPNLKHLFISSSLKHYPVRQFLENLWKRHGGISSLQYCSNPGLDVIRKLVALYPNVKKLEVKFNVEKLSTDELKEIFDAYGRWDVTCVDLFITCVMGVSQMETILEGISTWKGLKKVRLWSRFDSGDSMMEFSDTTKAAFLACRTCAFVELSCLKGKFSVLNRIEKFILVHKLPISIKSYRLHSTFKPSLADIDDWD